MIDLMKAEVKLKEIHKMGNRLLKEAGMPILDPIKRIGHGIGIENSEPPSINQVNTWYNILKPGLIITSEPRFDIEGVSPWRFFYEETVLITEDHHEILSKESNELVILKC
jgi:Xaa-Pro aminopeptidase